MLNRRDLNGLLLATAGTTWIGNSRTALAQSPVPLKKVARSHGTRFGVFVPSAVAHDKREQGYFSLIAREAEIIAGEHGTGIGRIWRNPEQPDFRDLDAELGLAKQLRLPFFAWLFWNEWPAPWLKSRSGDELRSFMARHLDLIMSRYRGVPEYWEVVNEPVWPDHRLPQGLRDGPYYKAMGADYIPWAFKRVKAMDPKARLVINEAHLERADRYGQLQRSAFLALLDRLLDAGTPIDAVGMQGHIYPTGGYSSTGVQEIVGRIAERKVGLIITEFDVDDRSFPEDIPTRDRMVAETGTRFLTDVFNVKKPELVMTFGLSDRHSWLKNDARYRSAAPGRAARPLPFDEQFQPKPLQAAMSRVFAEAVRQ